MAHNYSFPMFEPMSNGTVEVISCQWPGGYPVYYLAEDGGTLCPHCVESNLPQIGEAHKYGDIEWNIVASGANWEDPIMFCGHCGNRIESAYAEDEA